MKVTQTERPFSILEIKVPQKIRSDENDPLRYNTQNTRQQETKLAKQHNNENQNKKLTKIRREYLKKIEEMQIRHSKQLLLINKKHQEQTKILTAKYQKQLAEKQQHIKLLEQIIKEKGPLLETKKHRPTEQSKYIYTEHTKNHIPYYEQISDRIDFKLQPSSFEKNLSLDNKSIAEKRRKMIQSYSTNHHHSSNSNQSSKHKLIPKQKPSDSNHSERQLKVELPSYKNCHNIKMTKPFFL